MQLSDLPKITQPLSPARSEGQNEAQLWRWCWLGWCYNYLHVPCLPQSVVNAPWQQLPYFAHSQHTVKFKKLSFFKDLISLHEENCKVWSLTFHIWSKGICTLQPYLVECAQANGTRMEPVPVAECKAPRRKAGSLQLSTPNPQPCQWGSHASRHLFEMFTPRWLKVPKNKW